MKHADNIDWFAAADHMGGDYLSAINLPFITIGQVDQHTKDVDTIRIAREMVDNKVDLIVFVGGDGTARDIHDAVNMQVPVVAVPSGVKIYSAAFALSPRSAANLVDAFLENDAVIEKEVLDIDEQAFRENRLEAHFIGYLLVPDIVDQIQPGKEGTHLTLNTIENQRDIAAGFVETIDKNKLYFLGPGTTVKAITDMLDLPKTLLGVDAILDGKVIGTDLNEYDMLTLIQKYPKICIVITPLGGNGFIFGRGNKQFTPAVIRQVGKANLQLVATEAKLDQVRQLRVDTGDELLDNELAGYVEVMVGYRKGKVMVIVAV
jgi:predicted polyphosphate/ATP-dependent NAD kinase